MNKQHQEYLINEAKEHPQFDRDQAYSLLAYELIYKMGEAAQIEKHIAELPAEQAKIIKLINNQST